MTTQCPKCKLEIPDESKFCSECGLQIDSIDEMPVPPTQTLEAPREELKTGSTFAGRYQIIEELGKGGMGKVYRALDKKLNEEMALKLIKPEIASDKKTLERFQNELKLARKIRHSKVGGMYELLEDRGLHYISMEYVSGEDLKSFIYRSGRLTASKAINLANQICEGLVEAHKLGVIHRDLKPSNIMIDKDGNARIMDFGIARSLKEKGITGAGVMIGTPEYMSPEQVEGKEIDQRTDIYSLGVILYEMVTGRVPFEGDTALTVAVKHKTEEPKDPREFNTQISEDLSRVILRCLEKEAHIRYQSAGELRSELENIEEGIPTTERVIPERKPLTSREITVTFGIKRLLIPALVIIGLVILTVIAWQLLSNKEGIPISPDKPTLAIVYFKNNTGDESLDNLRSALSDLLITDLSQSRHIRVLTADRIYEILEQLSLQEAKSYSSEDLKKVAVKGGASHIVQGNFIKLGETFRIDINLKESNAMKSIGTEKIEGKGEESIFTMVDELTRRIKLNFRLSEETIAGDIDKKVEEITTRSPKAYKLYVDGRKYHGQGNFRKSIDSMEKAIAIDPEFAMAYRSMGASHWSLYNTTESIECYKRAFELADRLPEREKYLIQGNHYQRSEKTWGKAIDAFNKLLELYPEDETGLGSLAFLYDDIEEFDKAIELLEKCIQQKGKALAPYANLANEYRRKGLFDESQKVLEGYLKDINDTAVGRYHLARHFFLQGKFDLALAEAERSLSLDSSLFRNFWIKGDVYLYQEDYNRAEREYKKLLEQKEESAQSIGRGKLADLNLLLGKFERSEDLLQNLVESARRTQDRLRVRGGHSSLSYLYLKSEVPEKALEECKKVWDLAVEAEHLGGQRNALYTKSQAYLALGSPDKALRTAEELKELIDQGINTKLLRMYYHLRGLIELDGGQYSRAIDFFKKALPLLFVTSYWHMILADSLGAAYFGAGNLERAQEEYEKVVSHIPGRISYGDIYTKAFYMLGKINEEQGNSAKAIEHYEKFLTLWKDADPGIAEVEDARERLAGLKG
jgi:serine/threonine protein kinase/predicted Zn-dependent protease